MKKNRATDNLSGLMGDAIRASGRMVSKTEKEFIVTNKELKGLEYGQMEKR